MRSKKTFHVKSSPFMSNMCLCMVLLFFGMELAYLFTTSHPQLVFLIIITAVFVIPFFIAWLWAKRYSIKVQGTSISVQKSFRIKPVCFDVSEITKAVYLITETRMGLNVKVTVYTSGYGKFTVETLMINSDKMCVYLEEYAGHKIQTIHKKIGV